MLESSIYKYYRTINTKLTKHLLVERLGKNTIFILFTNSQYKIYDIDSFNTIFISKYISNINIPYLYNDILYICSSNKIYIHKRGLKISSYMFDRPIYNILCLSDIRFVLLNNNILNICNESFNIINQVEGITFVYHPITYINKILIRQDERVLIYNFIKDKVIYEYINIKNDFLNIKSTTLVDIVCIVYKTKLEIFNLKQDKLIYTLEISHTDSCDVIFSDIYMGVICDSILYIYDLDTKKKILYKTGVLNAYFLDNKNILITTKEDVGIYVVSYKLNIIKRNILHNSSIKEIECIDNNKIGIVNDRSVCTINLYNDSDTHKIQLGDTQIGDNNLLISSIYNQYTIVYKNNTLYKLDLYDKKYNVLLRHKVKGLSLYKDRLLIISDNICIMSINSGAVHYTINKEYINGFYSNGILYKEYIISYSNNEVYVYNIETKEERVVIVDKEFNNIILQFKIKEDILVAKTNTHLLFYNIDSLSLFREYPISNIIDWDINRKFLCILCYAVVYVYDLLSNIRVDNINIIHPYKYIRFSRNNFFILLVDYTDAIVLLSKKIYKCIKDNTKRLSNIDIIPDCLENTENINWKMNIMFNMKYQEIDVDDVLRNILDNIKNDYIKYNSILNIFIKRYSSYLNKEKMREFYKKYKEIGEKYTDNYIRCIKYK